MAVVNKWKFAALAPVIWLLACGCAAEAAAPAPALLPPAGVADDTAVVTRRDVEISTVLYARLKPEEHEVKFGNTSLAAKTVEALPGQKVKKGDALIRLDVEYIQKNIDDLTKQLVDITNQYGYDDADRQTELSVARIQLNNLIAGGAGDTDIQLQNLNVRRLELVGQQARQSEDDDIAVRQQAIDKLKQTVDQAQLVSDADGTVVSVAVSPGDTIKPFQTGAVIADDGSVYAEYTGKASMSSLSSMLSITAHIGGADYDMAFQPMPIAQVIAYIFSGLTPPSKFTFKDKAAGQLTAGETAVIRCVSNVSKNTLTVPVNAVYADGSGKYVYVKTSDSAQNTVKRLTPVKTGISNECVTEITDGLEGGETVYVKP